MANIDPSEAARIAHGEWVDRSPALPLRSFAIDTRRLEAGETFVALRTERSDGHRFIEKAFQYKATAAVVEKPDTGVPIPQLVVDDTLKALQELAREWRVHFESPVIGITGSNGKTTVKEMLSKVLGSQWFKTQGNYNNHIGVPLSLLDLDPHRHAGALLEAGINNRGEMDLLAGLIRPDHAIITSVGPSHLEGLGDLEGVAREKAILAEKVRPGGCVYLPAGLLQYPAFRDLPQNLQVHALLREGEHVDKDSVSGFNVLLYDYRWTEKSLSPGEGILHPGLPTRSGNGFSFRAGSDGMVSNLALVVHVAMHMGVPDGTIQACLDSWRPFRQRGEIMQHGKTRYYVDCYNANPASMHDSAQRFNKLFPDAPHCYVLGTMNELGDEAAAWHRRTARKLPLRKGSDVFLVGQYAEAYAEGLKEQGIPEENIHLGQDSEALAMQLSNFHGAIFLKGSRSLQLETLLPEGGQRC